MAPTTRKEAAKRKEIADYYFDTLLANARCKTKKKALGAQEADFDAQNQEIAGGSRDS